MGIACGSSSLPPGTSDCTRSKRPVVSLAMTIYILVSLLALIVVLAALFPRAGRKLAEDLGLWPWIERIDGNHLRRFMALLGTLLLLSMLAMLASVLVGFVTAAWLVPAAQAGLFGAILYWVSRPH